MSNKINVQQLNLINPENICLYYLFTYFTRIKKCINARRGNKNKINLAARISLVKQLHIWHLYHCRGVRLYHER